MSLPFELGTPEAGLSVIIIVFTFVVYHGLRTEVDDVDSSGLVGLVAFSVMQGATGVNCAPSSF